MYIVLSEGAAQELGRALRLIRNTQQITLRDVARQSGLSAQYINNIERGDRLTVSVDAFERLAKALDGPPGAIEDLLLRARMTSALADRGLSAEQAAFVMKGVEQRLSEVGAPTKSLGDVITDLMSPRPVLR
jgi:transcriptional regulator with XRE-family HTH domain